MAGSRHWNAVKIKSIPGSTLIMTWFCNMHAILEIWRLSYSFGPWVIDNKQQKDHPWSSNPGCLTTDQNIFFSADLLRQKVCGLCFNLSLFRGLKVAWLTNTSCSTLICSLKKFCVNLFRELKLCTTASTSSTQTSRWNRFLSASSQTLVRATT